ncbi:MULTISPECIES: BA14K family protein [unclassified Bradyrhizobium]|uniref:BA14K family protein n=1 Tax=unclassified Bradyrhizobium TaxID=2631580 RepID=UPI002FF066E1
MISLKVLSAAAAMALVLPVVAPSLSAVQAQDRGGAVPSIGGARGGGGGGAAIGGGGIRGGGVAVGGGGVQAGGPAIGGGRAVAPGAPSAGFRPSPGIGGPAVVGGGGRGNYYAGRWHGGHFHRHRHGFWPGFAIGAGIGSAYGYYGSTYYDDPYYYDDTVVAAAPVADDDAVAYCMRRYKSYDPASGTYLGYDGQRHPCPAQ